MIGPHPHRNLLRSHPSQPDPPPTRPATRRRSPPLPFSRPDSLSFYRRSTAEGGKREIRIRGSDITPGYLNRPDATAAAFDEDGFYRTGDAVVFVDDADPDQGLMFDGRIAKDSS